MVVDNYDVCRCSSDRTHKIYPWLQNGVGVVGVFTKCQIGILSFNEALKNIYINNNILVFLSFSNKHHNVVKIGPIFPVYWPEFFLFVLELAEDMAGGTKQLVAYHLQFIYNVKKFKHCITTFLPIFASIERLIQSAVFAHFLTCLALFNIFS